ncbi:MAG: class B sortase [Acutalibacteraceae bacterium]
MATKDNKTSKKNSNSNADKQRNSGPVETPELLSPEESGNAEKALSLEEAMASFRVIYEDTGDSRYGRKDAAPEEEVQNLREQQCEKGKPNNTKPGADFLSSLRIIYEHPEDQDEVQSTVTTEEQPAYSSDVQTADQTEEQPIPSQNIKKADSAQTPISPIPDEDEEFHTRFAVYEKALDNLLIDNDDIEVEVVEDNKALNNDFAEMFRSPEENKARKSAWQKFSANTIPRKGDSLAEVLRKTILIIALITMFVCAVILANIYVISPYLSKRDSQKNIDVKINSNNFSDWAKVENEYPGVIFPLGMQPKYAGLYVQNNDFVGWVEINSLGLSQPVVKGKTNQEYLRKTFSGSKSKYGCCFLDSANNFKLLDRNTVIYGHNMKYDDLMFGVLESYRTVDGYKSAPVITFNTLYKDMKWKIYAVIVTNGDASTDNGYLFNYIFRNLSNDKVFMSFIRELDQRKLYTTGVDIQPGDKILTLSTCSYDFKNARLAVIARLIREGESEDVDFSKTAINPNPRYPQAWYNDRGKTNPYKDSFKWVPG